MLSKFRNRKEFDSDSDMDETSSISGQSDDEEPGHPPLTAIPPGFALPDLIKITPLANFIQPGDVRICKLVTIYDPSEFWIAFPNHFPVIVDNFANKMSMSYKELGKAPGRFEWIAHPLNVNIGSIVAVFRHDLNEWARAKVLGWTGKDSDRNYKLRLVDFGEYYEKEMYKVHYLQRQFIEEPQYVVRCRVVLGSSYDKFHNGKEPWSNEVKLAFFNALKLQEIEVKFIRQVPVPSPDGDTAWEVSLENFKEPNPDFIPGIPIQKQVIKQAMGKYFYR